MATKTAEPTDASEYVEEEVPMDKLVELLHDRFTVINEFSTSEDRAASLKRINEIVRAQNMLPYYEAIREIIDIKLTGDEIAAMEKTITARLESLEAKLNDAKENLGDSEVREALQAKVDFYASIGDLDKFLQAAEICSEKTLANGPKMDLCFQRVRMGLAFADNGIVSKGLDDAQKLSAKGDWERRNRLKVYEGLCAVSLRNFQKGSQLLMDSLATFAATELMTFEDYVFLTVISSLTTLPRGELKKNIVDSPEVLSSQQKEAIALVDAIYTCRYKDVFDCLAAVCHKMRQSSFLVAHVNYFFREVRILVFNQFLDSYRSVTLKSMAASFNLPEDVLDRMLYTLISNERLSCKIDRVSGNVLTYRGSDKVNLMYHRIMKEGDILLNKIQKLSRVIEM